MKKNIIIVSHSLEIGGAERSLIGLLDSLDPSRCNVDLFLLRHEGELMEYIPEYVNLLPEISQYTVLARPMKKTMAEGHIVLTLARLIGKIAAGHYDSKHKLSDSAVDLEYSHKYTIPFMPKIQNKKKYDLAISFMTPHYIVAKKIKADRKAAWIHTDYSKIQINSESEIKMWNSYDSIVSISDAVTDSFIKKFPTLENKIVCIENILPKNMILQQSKDVIPENEMPDDEAFHLLSIGRFCYAKNFDNIPDICSKIIKSGTNVKWYIIGYGGDEALIKQQIIECGMEEHVIILGKKNNPYPYIKACDLYVQPSRYEGKCVSVREAQMLGKAVVITNYATASSQIKNDYDGVIVPMNNEQCAQEIVSLLNQPERMIRIAEQCHNNDFSNHNEVEKIYLL